jgi:hypothetical protein
VAGATCRAAMRIVAGVGDQVQRTVGDNTYRVLGGRAIKRSDGAVCGLYHTRRVEDREFLG